MRGRVYGRLLVLISGITFATLPILTIVAMDSGANLITLLFLRFSIAAIILFAIAGQQGHLFRTPITSRQFVVLFCLGGIGYVLQSSFYLSSLHYVPASTASFLFCTYPFFVAGIECLLGRNKFTLWEAGALLLALAGVRLLSTGKFDCSGADPRGMGLAFAGAGVYSIYITVSKQALADIPAHLGAAIVAWSSAITLLAAGLVTKSLQFSMSRIAWATAAGMGVISTALPMGAFFAGLATTGPAEAATLSLVEPVATALMARILGERLSALQCSGAALCVMGVAAYVWRQTKRPKRPSLDC